MGRGSPPWLLDSRCRQFDYATGKYFAGAHGNDGPAKWRCLSISLCPASIALWWPWVSHAALFRAPSRLLWNGRTTAGVNELRLNSGWHRPRRFRLPEWRPDFRWAE